MRFLSCPAKKHEFQLLTLIVPPLVSRTLHKSLTPNIDQTASIQFMVQVTIMAEPIVVQLAEEFVAQNSTVPSVDAADANPETIILEEGTIVLAEVTPSSNPKNYSSVKYSRRRTTFPMHPFL